MKYLLLALLWIVWCAIHSGMISLTATVFFKRRLGPHYRFYRLFFNLVAMATIIPVVLYASSLDGHVLFRWDGFLIGVQVLLLAASGLLFIAGARHHDMLLFLGIRQIWTGSSHNALTESGQLNTMGILNVTRHPWYLATVLLVWTAYGSMDIATLITNVILTAYLIVGTILEERKLVVEFGDEYREYQKRVPMLIPVPWRRMAKSTEVEK
jgi:protein-S-isoprenylcysteine O-methyltransferase Ste14